MIKFKGWLKWLMFLAMPMMMGSDSESDPDSSTTATTTTTNDTVYTDKRNVASEGAVSLSGDGNKVTNSYTTTDLGAINSAFGAVGDALTLAGNVASKSVDLGSASVAGALTSVKAAADANQATFKAALDLIGSDTAQTKDAFKTATEEVNGNRALVIVGMIAVGAMVMQKGLFS